MIAMITMRQSNESTMTIDASPYEIELSQYIVGSADVGDGPVAVGVGVLDAVGVFVGVLVDVGVDVMVGVSVGPGSFVGVLVGVDVFVGVDVLVDVGVWVGVFVGVLVGVAVGPSGAYSADGGVKFPVHRAIPLLMRNSSIQPLW